MVHEIQMISGGTVVSTIMNNSGAPYFSVTPQDGVSTTTEQIYLHLQVIVTTEMLLSETHKLSISALPMFHIKLINYLINTI